MHNNPLTMMAGIIRTMTSTWPASKACLTWSYNGYNDLAPMLSLSDSELCTSGGLLTTTNLRHISRFPTAHGSSGHRLFTPAFVIASKVICGDTYSNKSWSIVGQGMFQLREIN